MHGTEEIKQQERALKLVLHCFPLLWLAQADLVASQAHDLLNVVVHTSKPPQNICIVRMAVEAEGMVSLMICNLSSMLVSLEQGLKGTFADLIW